MVEGRLAFGVPSLDSLLGGGLERASLTEVFGEGGTGKTNLCLQLTCRVALEDAWVFYIDTEGLSLDRLGALAAGMGKSLPEVLRRLLVTTPKSLVEQETAVNRVSDLIGNRQRPVGLVVLDSATLLYRLELGLEDESEARRSLSTQLATLLHAALDFHVPVIFTNQVFRDSSTGQFEPIGGTFANHVAKTILRLDRGNDGWRRATLLKSRSLPEGGTAEFRLTNRGIESPTGTP